VGEKANQECGDKECRKAIAGTARCYFDMNAATFWLGSASRGLNSLEARGI
jgi:hypothetical protein